MKGGDKVTLLDDAEIIELLNSRSEGALDALERKYGGTCMKTAMNILAQKSDAEECVNDAMLAVWNSVPPEDPSPLGAYIRRITRNIAVDRMRRETAQKRRTNYARAIDELAEAIGADDVSEAVDAAELTGEINEFLARLDAEARIMFVRRYYYGDAVKDIAKRLSLPARAVSVKLFRVREKLGEILKEKGYDV